MARILAATPALPVSELSRSVAFYVETLGMTLDHRAPGYAILLRDSVAIHLWEASDTSWRERGDTARRPVVSGAESFIAGTASVRLRCEGIDALHEAIRPSGAIHPNAPLAPKPWGTREFGVLDPDGNLVTFVEPVAG